MSKVAEIFQTLEYGPAPESAVVAHEWLDARDRRFGIFIANTWVEPDGGEYFETVNPATAKPLARIAQGSTPDVGAAVNAASTVLADWRALRGHGRARYLYALARKVQKNARLFAVLESLDSGKPIRESRDIDIPLVARHFYHHAGWAQLLDSEFQGYQAVGVTGQIIPRNFPLLMLAWKIAPALAAGCTVVLKPAEFTSLTALLFAEVCRDAGLPAGVVNIVTGDGRTGEALVKHPGVDKIAFTGSLDVGRIIRRATAGTGKKISLELGGTAPFITFEDADLDSVVEGVVDATWFNPGQVRCAGWINCANVIDAAAGFGGYRESGFGRKGGREGLWEYLVPSWEKAARKKTRSVPASGRAAPIKKAGTVTRDGLPSIDRTAKLYIGGKQARPDQGYSLPIAGANGAVLGEAARGTGQEFLRHATQIKNIWIPYGE